LRKHDPERPKKIGPKVNWVSFGLFLVASAAPCGKIAETLSACQAGAHFSVFGDGTSKFD